MDNQNNFDNNQQIEINANNMGQGNFFSNNENDNNQLIYIKYI